jgi:hypothetical protein
MSTQIVTILKIAGASGEYVLKQFERFKAGQRVGRDPGSLISTDHWTPACRRKIDAFAENLRIHNREVPIVFSAEYVDMWSTASGASPSWRLPTWQESAIQLYTDDRWLECYRLPDGGRLQADLKRAFRQKSIRERNPQEVRWPLVLLTEAVEAWEPLVDSAALIVIGLAVAPMVEDEEIRESLGNVPAWLRRKRHAEGHVEIRRLHRSSGMSGVANP